MKTKILFFILAFFLSFTLVGCAEGGGSSSPEARVVDPTPVVPGEPDDGGEVEEPTNPEEPGDGGEVEEPTEPEEPTQPEEPAQPGVFSCWKSSNNVFCSGGNLGTDIGQIDMAGTFTGNNPQATIYNVIVTNNRIATGQIGVLQNGTQNTSTPICSQPNGPGCFAQSSCVEVSVKLTGVTQVYKFMACGNGFNRSTNKFQSQ